LDCPPIACPDRMKAKEHRVPLSSRALAILLDNSDLRTSDYLPDGKAGDSLSNMAMTEVPAAHRPRRYTVLPLDFPRLERTKFPSEVAR
jgi:hypothetical protein